MKLVVISNMAHYRSATGQIVGHGATARELDSLATLFTEVRHLACLHPESPPASALPYRADNIELVPLPPAGGEHFRDKLDLIRLTPRYVGAIYRELARAEVVHIRCPANIPMLALGILPLIRHAQRRWIKYAGNWRPTRNEPASYALQRRWLAQPSRRAQVTINGHWDDQPAHVHSFHNPCLTDDDLQRGRVAAQAKEISSPVRLVFVGNLIPMKNPRTAVEIVAVLAQRGIAAELDIIGDGPERGVVERAIQRCELSSRVRVHGALPRHELDNYYARAHFVVLPSNTEGWPKVLSEGMAFGAVPVATAVGSIPEVLSQMGTGAVREAPPSAESFADAIASYVREPARWRRDSDRGVEGSRAFSYASYLDQVRRLLRLDQNP